MKNNTVIGKLLILRNWKALPSIKWYDVRNLMGMFLPISKIYVKDVDSRWMSIKTSNREDFSTYYSIWRRKDYQTEMLDFDVIFDFGANIGLATLYLSKEFPDSKIFAFEPDVETFKVLQKNITKRNNVLAYNKAIGIESGELNFYHSVSGKTSGLLREYVNDFTNRISKVSVASIKETLLPYVNSNILIKLDIEGLEMEVLEEIEKLTFAKECHIVFEKDVNYDSKILTRFTLIKENDLIGYIKL